jgi:uncharacterized protein
LRLRSRSMANGRLVPFPGCLVTFDGKLLDLKNPDPTSFSIGMLAHGLSMCCRYRCQCLFFWSVAQHSLRVAKLISVWYKHLPLQERAGLTLQALVHDTCESGLGDMPTPEKVVTPGRSEQEDLHMKRIYEGLGLPFTETDVRVKEADEAVLGVEQRILIPENAYWPYILTEEEANKVMQELGMPIEVEDMEQVEEDFLFLYYSLVDLVNGHTPEEMLELTQERLK